MAAFAEIVDGKIRFRAQILSEDGRDQLREDVIFECADLDAPRQLAHAMIEKAPRFDPLSLQRGMRRTLRSPSRTCSKPDRRSGQGARSRRCCAAIVQARTGGVDRA